MKIAYQGISGSYSESCAKLIYPKSETIPCKTFDECFEKANLDKDVKTLISINKSKRPITSVGCNSVKSDLAKSLGLKWLSEYIFLGMDF